MSSLTPEVAWPSSEQASGRSGLPRTATPASRGCLRFRHPAAAPEGHVALRGLALGLPHPPPCPDPGRAGAAGSAHTGSSRLPFVERAQVPSARADTQLCRCLAWCLLPSGLSSVCVVLIRCRCQPLRTPLQFLRDQPRM